MSSFQECAFNLVPPFFAISALSCSLANGRRRQCDQMTILCFQYLANFSNENLH